MTVKTAHIRVPDFSNNKSTFIVQETTNQPTTERHADDLPASEEDDQYLVENNRLHLTHLVVQRMIDSSIPIYEETTLK